MKGRVLISISCPSAEEDGADTVREGEHYSAFKRIERTECRMTRRRCKKVLQSSATSIQADISLNLLLIHLTAPLVIQVRGAAF